MVLATASKPARTVTRKGSVPKGGITAVAPESPTRMLDEFKFDYELALINLSDINVAESHRNQARISQPIDEEQALLYGEQMEAGAVFPPIVVYKGRSGYIVMDGNHRVAGAELAKVATFRAYVVKDPSPAQITAFTYAANTRHGLPTSLDDRIRQAIFLTEKDMSSVEAARQLGIPVEKLRTALVDYKATKRFEQLGIRKFAGLSRSAQRTLSRIKSDTVLKAAADLTVEARLGQDDLNALVTNINKKGEQKDQLATVARKRESLAAAIKTTAGGRAPIPQPLVTLARFTSGIGNFQDPLLVDALRQVPAEARSEYAKAAKEAGTRLIEIAALAQRGVEA